MKHQIIAILCSLLLTNLCSAQLPQVASGSIKRFENFKSKYVDSRNIDVWLPEDYTNKKKYAVLYMQDGNSLFDSSIMWNKQEWEVDETVSKLIEEKKLKDVIIVGIWNNGQQRHSEYFPQKPYETLSDIQKEFITKILQEKGRTTAAFKPQSNNYLKFIVEELKPFIDSSFSTKKERKNTFIAGSSMGALISLYAICEYPLVFGGAACLSTHWPGIFSIDNNPVPAAFIKYLQTRLPNPNRHKIYFDYGDKTLDALYPTLQIKVDEILKAKRFSGKNWVTKYFPGEDHSERAWAKRLHVPLLFLLKN